MISENRISPHRVAMDFSMNTTSSRVFTPVIFVVLMIAAVVILANILTNEGTNMLASVMFLVGLGLAVFALMRPKPGFIVFLWSACTIDTIKRLAYQIPTFSIYDISTILGVPVLIMGAIYARVFFLFWFGTPEERLRVRFSNVLVIGLFLLAAVMSLFLQDQLNFEGLKTNYTFFVYIPAAVAVPYLFRTPEDWQYLGRHFFRLLLVIVAYGIYQSIRGPLNFEYEYMLSGFTSTEYYVTSEHFRPFSLLNAGSTYTGVLCMLTFLTLPWLCAEKGRVKYSGKVLLLFLLTAGACFLAGQRGSFFCFLLMLAFLKVLRYPSVVVALLLLGLVAYTFVVLNATWLKEQMYVVDFMLEPLRFNESMVKSTTVLTLGERLDGFIELQQSWNWTAFGFGLTPGKAQQSAGHDLISNLLAWVGWVGLLVFTAIVCLVVRKALVLLSRARSNPELSLWIEVNLCVFLFMMIWGLMLGSSIHVSPMNFFFWFSVGNLLLARRGLEEDAEVEAEENERVGRRLAPSPQLTS